MKFVSTFCQILSEKAKCGQLLAIQPYLENIDACWSWGGDINVCENVIVARCKKKRKSRKSRQILLQKKCFVILLAKICFDTAENGPTKVCYK